MNLQDLIDEARLQQDDWSLTRTKFGKEEQLEVIGWNGKHGSNRLYILKCIKCSEDRELFGEGYFKSLKGNLVNGQVPCGCAFNPKWSKEQFFVLCSRKAKELSYTFLGFDGEWRGAATKIKMLCEKHGEWSSGTIDALVNGQRGCSPCGDESTREVSMKPYNIMVQSFHESGGFNPATNFWRSERLAKSGYKGYWYMSCPDCGEVGEAFASNLQKGFRPCACSQQRQQEAYINWVVDRNNPIAIKFGVANSSKRRMQQQNSKSMYEVVQYATYKFDKVEACKKAERECRQTLVCGILSKEEMPDGYTETTWVYNLDKIIEIYERSGGVKIEATIREET